MPTTHSPPQQHKRPRSDDSITLNDIDNDENLIKLESGATIPTMTVLYNILMRNNKSLADLKEMFQYQFRENNELRTELSTLRTNYELLLVEVNKQSNTPKSTDEALLNRVNEVQESLNVGLIKVTESIAKKQKIQNVKSYADVAKRSHPVVVVKPKDNTQKSSATKSAISELIDPSKFTIQDVRTSKNGGIIIECDDVSKMEQLKKDVEQKLGSNYDISAPTGRCPKIKILGITEDWSIEKIENALLNQNGKFFSGCGKPKVVQKFKIKNSYGAKVEVDGVSFKRILDTGRIILGWDSCIVHEAFDCIRCFKCLGFHHLATSCKATKACSKCGDAHDLKDCQATIERCINCVNAVKRLNLDIDTGHSALSLKCSTYQKKIEAERKKINYNFSNKMDQ